MEKIICRACGAENMRHPKEPPTDQRQAKQISFICDACGRKNLRDGSVSGVEVLEAKEEVQKEKKDDLGGLVLLGGVATLVFGAVNAFINAKQQKSRNA